MSSTSSVKILIPNRFRPPLMRKRHFLGHSLALPHRKLHVNRRNHRWLAFNRDLKRRCLSEAMKGLRGGTRPEVSLTAQSQR